MQTESCGDNVIVVRAGLLQGPIAHLDEHSITFIKYLKKSPLHRDLLHNVKYL
jgi:hypothetical protein